MSDDRKPIDLERVRARLDISYLIDQGAPSVDRETAIALCDEVETLRAEVAGLNRQIEHDDELAALRERNKRLVSAVASALAALDAAKK